MVTLPPLHLRNCNLLRGKTECLLSNKCYQIVFFMGTCRVRKSRELRVKVVDVDGSYLHRKREHMIASGKEVAPLDLPSSPLSGWQEVNKDNFKEMAKEIPCVTPGKTLCSLSQIHKTHFYRAIIHLPRRRYWKHSWKRRFSCSGARF